MSTFAAGALVHAWQMGSTFGAITGLAAMWVLLRPGALGRGLLLFAALLLELVGSLPNPSNHLLLVGVVGGAICLWSWLTVRSTSAETVRESGTFYRLVGPFLRAAFLLTWVFAVFAKLNSGFLDPVASCAVRILESMPLLSVPAGTEPLVVVGTLALELSIPVLLFFRRTRPIAILLGLGFHLSSSLAGHAPFAAMAWSFYLLFLPEATLARAAVFARSQVPAAIRAALAGRRARPAGWITLGAAWLLARQVLVPLLPDAAQWPARRWGATLVCLLLLGAWGYVLLHLRHRRLADRTDATLRIRQGVFVAALVLLAVNSLSPYLGLKTLYSSTMYSNLRTEPGQWNHLIAPASMQVFETQGGLVQVLETSDPQLTAELAPEGRTLVLLDARRIIADYPDARVLYLLDGQLRTAAPVSADPVIRVPVSTTAELLGGYRAVDATSCQH